MRNIVHTYVTADHAAEIPRNQPPADESNCQGIVEASMLQTKTTATSMNTAAAEQVANLRRQHRADRGGHT